eukprot:scaffold3234_cov178-Ochromonas_danica.AAC.2
MINQSSQREGELVLDLLDNGLEVAYFLYEENDENSIEKQQYLATLPRHRNGLSLPANLSTIDTVISKYRDTVGNFLIRLSNPADVELIASSALALIKTPGDYSIEIFLSLPSGILDIPLAKALVSKHEHLHLLVEPSFTSEQVSDLPHLSHLKLTTTTADHTTNTTTTTTTQQHQQTISLIDLFLATIRTDRSDGLITTVVCDEHQRCLGLVYSSPASVSQAFLKRQGIYFSRSRQGLWHKGESSGMTQALREIRLDCDRDALRYSVYQEGHPPAFCHLLTRSCWGEQNGLFKLQHTLQQRKEHAPPGSYTQKLFQDNGLLRQKLLEEVQELVEAEEKDHIASEAADVLYFMMTRCIAAGVTLEDIERYLDLRSLKITRRPGLAKEWRTAAAEQALSQTADQKKSEK